MACALLLARLALGTLRRTHSLVSNDAAVSADRTGPLEQCHGADRGGAGHSTSRIVKRNMGRLGIEFWHLDKAVSRWLPAMLLLWLWKHQQRWVRPWLYSIANELCMPNDTPEFRAQLDSMFAE